MSCAASYSAGARANRMKFTLAFSETLLHRGPRSRRRLARVERLARFSLGDWHRRRGGPSTRHLTRTSGPRLAWWTSGPLARPQRRSASPGPSNCAGRPRSCRGGRDARSGMAGIKRRRSRRLRQTDEWLGCSRCSDTGTSRRGCMWRACRSRLSCDGDAGSRRRSTRLDDRRGHGMRRNWRWSRLCTRSRRMSSGHRGRRSRTRRGSSGLLQRRFGSCRSSRCGLSGGTRLGSHRLRLFLRFGCSFCSG